MKKLIAMVLCLALVFSLALTGCSEDPKPTESTKPNTTQSTQPSESKPADEVTIYDGWYAWENWRNGAVGLKTFIKLNENGTYYGLYFEGGVYEAGTFEIIEGTYSYRADGGADGEWGNDDDGFKDAPASIKFTTYDGKTMTAAFADGNIYDAVLGGMASYANMFHEPEYEYDPAVEELPITVQTFYADNLAGNSLTLYHDLTFVDYTGEIGVEGTWEKTGDNEYTLTDENNAVNKLVIDGKTGTYGDKTLSSVIVEEGAPTIINTFEVAEAQVGLPMPVALRIDCYSDATCKLYVIIEAIGAELLTDEGTYEVADAAAACNYTFHFVKGGDIVGAPDYATATAEGLAVDIAYKADVEVEFNGALTPLSIDATLRGMTGPDKIPTGPVEPTVKYTFRLEEAQVGLPMPVVLRLDCFDNGTCVLFMEVAQVGAELIVDQGSYAVDAAYAVTFTFDTAGEVVSTPDYAAATTEGLPSTVTYTCNTEADFMGSVVPLTVDATLTGTVTP